jgi:hypothetical protein
VRLRGQPGLPAHAARDPDQRHLPWPDRHPKELWLGFGADYRDELGVEASTPLEQAYPLVFLCSDAAVAISGITLVTDIGYFAAGVTEAFPSATPVANFLLGRM